ncbi:MAG: pentapeptide repeat-containing protein [Nitrospinaceae bacterium]|jgi:hypothetical protein|nr:pentapeptide repeat-containing protein [Nitrospinaceae bacterium]MBT3433697.1 pentapeptide repeat-containing protein [Nitrospinaceae bacterium]MBT3821443.1 pentapeptide repeat-containing protein [Nitrospinaceae bacterium]MBT4095370.1 pentapeptide repeat-containing protein [Nitrospinaceae bacterium]MBT4431756.1 pentapeptide repeat-containing protein [Nitrospinaceae bacterium]
MDSRLKDYLSNLKNDENNGLAFFLIIAVVVVAIVGWLLYFIPQLQTASVTTETLKLSFNAENEARKTLAQIFGGLVALVLVFLGWRRVKAAEENVRVMQEGQITERFTRAVEQLGDDKVQIRLGGIYALERIARDSQKDHWTIMEVLTAFVRESAKWDEMTESLPDLEVPNLPIDIQAALTVIGRRELAHEDENTPRLDIHGTVLSKAELEKANFSGANFRVAGLFRANFSKANLGEADLSLAALSEAKLIGSNLREANLFKARLIKADFTEADLSEADNLTREQIDSAITDEDTKLPDYLKF